MKIKITSLIIMLGIVLSTLMFSADFVSVVQAGFTPTPEPTNTNTPTATLIPTNTLVPTITNTPIPPPTSTSTNTPVPTITNTPTQTNTPSATNTPTNTPTSTNTPTAESNAGGGSGGATSTPSTTLNRESRASVPEDATTVPALGASYSLPFLIVMNVILLVVLIGLVAVWRAVMRVIKR